MNKAIKIIKNNWTVLLGVVLGLIGGFFYWKFAHCTNGTCLITSSPLMSSIWGGLTGGWLFRIFKAYKQ